MESKELRIGNYISANGQIVEVYSINSDGINLTAGDGPGIYPAYESRELHHLNLTDVILLNSGFKYKTHSLYNSNEKCFIYYNAGFEILQDSNGNFYLFNSTGDDYYDVIGVEIEHVHQLQNLYFALKDEELQVNL